MSNKDTSDHVRLYFNKIWSEFIRYCPDALAINQLFRSLNNRVINDHIALRTFNHSAITIDRIMQPFMSLGYQACGEYRFEERKLYARHYEHTDPLLPKIFISELESEKLSDKAQDIIHSLTSQIDPQTVSNPCFCYSGSPWKIHSGDYKQLLRESDYAAWVSAIGFIPNHFTVAVNHLISHSTLTAVNQLLLKKSFSLNDNGGLIKGTPEVRLEQSSTIAKPVIASFMDKKQEVPGCFYEFARRYPLPDGKLYQGFITASANSIFSSTDATHKYDN
ncbi:hypothetical protein CI610_02013 [invertebrate metagenome]|uniref:2-oxoadipate dioxygenase/decarboxylase n=1 Tax=invertebrate metagenome TaxID=1711999 RepID=A0A2H9T716_9ZZZZ